MAAVPDNGAQGSDDTGDYSVGVPIDRPDVAMDTYAIEERVRPEREWAPPPRPRSRSEFFSTVYLFPWRRGSAWRWMLMTFGITPGLVLLALAVDPTPFPELSSMGRLGLIALATPLIGVLLSTLAYAAAIFSSVFEATAAGADAIESWPDDEWTEWLEQVVHLGYSSGVAAIACYALAWGVNYVASWWLVSGDDLFYAATFVTFLLLSFPVVFLSSHHAESRAVPLTRSVLQSVNRKPRENSWLIFECACAPLVLLPLTQVLYSRQRFLCVAAAGLGPQLAAAVLIYARLLGRLAWEIGEGLPDEPDEPDEDQPAPPAKPRKQSNAPAPEQPVRQVERPAKPRKPRPEVDDDEGPVY